MKLSDRRIRGHQSRLGFFVGLLGLFLLVGLISVIQNRREGRNWWIPPFDAIARQHILLRTSTQDAHLPPSGSQVPQTLWLFHLPLECDGRPRSRQALLSRVDSIFARLSDTVRLISELPSRCWQEFVLDLSVCQPENAPSRFLLTIQDFAAHEEADGEAASSIVSAVTLRASEQGQPPFTHEAALNIQRKQISPNFLPPSSLTDFYFTSKHSGVASTAAALPEHLELRVHRNFTGWLPAATGLLSHRPLFSSCSDVQLIFPNVVDKNAPDRVLTAPTFPKFFSGSRMLHSFKDLVLLETTLAFSYTTMNSAKHRTGERAVHLWTRAILKDASAPIPDSLEFELFLFYEQFIQTLAPHIATKMF